MSAARFLPLQVWVCARKQTASEVRAHRTTQAGALAGGRLATGVPHKLCAVFAAAHCCTKSNKEALLEEHPRSPIVVLL
eukprot:8649286-Pyramimonas_sp.AAC.1